MNNIEKRMQELKPSGLSGSEKERIWSRVETRLSSPKSFSVLPGFPTLKTIRRVSVPLVVAFGLILGGGATVYAHEAALPGDLLFPVKIHVEKAQIFLAQNSAKKDELRIKFSEKRLDEVRILAGSSLRVEAEGEAGVETTTRANGEGASSTAASAHSKKSMRTDRAITAALTQLEETKASLQLSGSNSGVLILEDIINELKGVGNGTVTITKVAMNGGKEHDNNVKVYATITGTSTGTTTASTITRVKFEEKKQGAKIEIKTSILSGLLRQGDKREDKEEKEDRHESKNDHDDDADNGNDDDRDSKKDDNDDDDEKKVHVCHKTDEGAHTISVSVRAARARISHGDMLGVCSDESQDFDTTAPVILGVTATSIAGGATISFATNEPATAVVYVGTTNPLLVASANSVVSPTATTTHRVVFSELATSTTHYYVIVAKDLSVNTTTGSQGSFLTN